MHLEVIMYKIIMVEESDLLRFDPSNLKVWHLGWLLIGGRHQKGER